MALSPDAPAHGGALTASTDRRPGAILDFAGTAGRAAGLEVPIPDGCRRLPIAGSGREYSNGPNHGAIPGAELDPYIYCQEIDARHWLPETTLRTAPQPSRRCTDVCSVAICGCQFSTAWWACLFRAGPPPGSSSRKSNPCAPSPRFMSFACRRKGGGGRGVMVTPPPKTTGQDDGKQWRESDPLNDRTYPILSHESLSWHWMHKERTRSGSPKGVWGALQLRAGRHLSGVDELRAGQAVCRGS